MIRSLRSLSSFLSLAATLWLGNGCDGAPSEAAEQAEMGTLEVPLIATSNGHTYRLNGTIYISGTDYAYLSTGSEPAETVLSAQLRPGDYRADLYYWTLEREIDAGRFVPVVATLVNPSVPFDVLNGTTSSITYQFETDGVIVVVGAGTVNVRVAVTEIAGICSPLGTDCGAGTWCAPPELTGAPLACILAGSTAIGDPCLDPSECSANSSCVDLGAGPVCAELCAAAAFDTECASGGVCRAAGSSYGVCRPSTPTEPAL